MQRQPVRKRQQQVLVPERVQQQVQVQEQLGLLLSYRKQPVQQRQR